MRNQVSACLGQSGPLDDQTKDLKRTLDILKPTPFCVMAESYNPNPKPRPLLPPFCVVLSQGWNLDSFSQWLVLANVTDPVTYVSDPTILLNTTATNFTNYRMIYIPSAYRIDNPGGITNSTNDALTLRSSDLINYVNMGGSLIVLTQSGLNNPYAFLPNPLIFQPFQFQAVNVSGDMPLFSPTSNAANLFHSMWHGYFTGPVDWSGIYRVLVYQQNSCPVANGANQNCNATMIANVHTKLTSHSCSDKATDATTQSDPACWRWVGW